LFLRIIRGFDENKYTITAKIHLAKGDNNTEQQKSMAVRDGRGKPKFLEGDGKEFNTERKTSPDHCLATRYMNV